MTTFDPLPMALGTAQLGMAYGIANRSGRPDLSKARAIVHVAWKEGIRFFDTAQAYGDSERVLGECIGELGEDRPGNAPSVISKLHPETVPSDEEAVIRSVEESLSRLRIKSLWGLLLHRESWLGEETQSLERVADRLKGEGKTKFFGISVYTPEKAAKALNTDGIDLVQVPFSVLDQRALRHGIFETAWRKNKKVFVRSVYLQGLLMIDPKALPPCMAFAGDALRLFFETARKEGLSPRLLALSYVVQHATGACIVIGAEEPSQVRDNVALLRQSQQLPLPDLSFLGQEDPRLINPALWPASR